MQGQAEGERRQQQELRGDAHRHRAGHAQHALEILDAGVQRDAEHQEGQHGIQRGQRGGVEVEADLVERHHAPAPKAAEAARTALR
jgi:hypothetical protein